MKFQLDGSPQGYSAANSAEYVAFPNGTSPFVGATGESHLKGQGPFQKEWTMDGTYFSITHGMQVANHVNGDLSVAELFRIHRNMSGIFGIEKLRSLRNHMIHLPNVNSSQLLEAKHFEFMATVLIGNIHWWGHPLCNVVYGPDFTSQGSFFGVKSLLEAGLVTSLHDDAPVNPPSGLLALWAATNRSPQSDWTYADNNTVTRCNFEVQGPGEIVSIMDALRGITIAPAHQLNLEKSVGSIEVGKAADFTILSDDPLTIDPKDLRNIQVTGTVRSGEYRSSDDAPAPSAPVLSTLEVHSLLRSQLK